MPVTLTHVPLVIANKYLYIASIIYYSRFDMDLKYGEYLTKAHGH